MTVRPSGVLCRRLFAVIPAAGRSRRMGQPKLLLPMGGTTVIGRLLGVLSDSGVEAFVLVRPDDDTLRVEVAQTAATIVQPDVPPPEMRVSIEHLLQAIEQQRQPQTDDGWLLIPADHPLLSPATLHQIIDWWQRSPEKILVPTSAGRRGHPTLLPWSLAESVTELPDGVGVNHLLRQHPDQVVEVPVDDPTLTLDVDTPADYERARKWLGG